MNRDQSDGRLAYHLPQSEVYINVGVSEEHLRCPYYPFGDKASVVPMYMELVVYK
jgi:hypothetical protein